MEILPSMLHGSLSFAMLAGAIAVSNLFSGQPSTKYFVGSLICWFIILGPLRWFNNALADVVDAHRASNRQESNAGDQFRAWIYLIILFALCVYGIYLLVVGVSHIS